MARSSAEVPCTANQFLVWSGGDVDDFELKLKFRILGPKSANSGVQIRSQIAADGHASGYQCDIDRSGQWLGALYDEHTGRRGLAKKGTKTTIDRDGERTSSAIEGPPPRIDLDDWNEYHIVARGERITLRINGVMTADVTDRERAHRDLQGRLALQIHSGPPMSVEFKDIHLKRLPLTDDRRKIVLIAGAPSHPCGQHEFNAGTKLLAKRLKKFDSVAVVSYHDNGWPKDPSAFDNANAVIVYSDGEGRHPLRGKHPAFEALAKRGVGLMCMHYAVHVDAGAQGDTFQRWIGGYYESGFSSNPHWTASLAVDSDHPIGRGVSAADIHDEWYFNIRFRDDQRGVTTVLEAKPNEKARAKNGYPPKPYPHIIAAKGRSETLMWAVERPDGGRGVGFTGGHWHRNWAHETQRRAVLNAILWVAGADVPKTGAVSDPVTEAELNAHLDKKKEMVHITAPKL